ncbi:RNA polymerase sigma-70 factor [Bacteroidaceae bacterium HV4-6-C5C]|nr:RNA polymerase sigma-70 factor [Bacteroidaceae bacterium HV4-6-C5C]
MDINDDVFLEKINSQSPTAYHELYNEYYKALVIYAANFLATTDTAEDIVQEIFATIWEKKISFISLQSLKTYLYNSTRNAALNYLKHQNVETGYIQYMLDTYKEITEEDTNEEEVYRILFKSIDQLPPRCHEIFVLHMEGKKNEEIAQALGLSIETVKTQKKRALQSLKRQMGSLFFLTSLINMMNY